MSKILGLFLCFVGLSFFVLLFVVSVDGQLAGNIKVGAFLVFMAAVTLWAGLAWWFGDGLLFTLLSRRIVQLKPKLRIPSELVAIVGCVLIGLHATMLGTGHKLLPPPMLSSAIACPILLAWIAKDFALTPLHLNRVMISGIRIFADLGYVAIFVLVWPRLSSLIPGVLRPPLYLIGFVLISFLYACQAVILHFGSQVKPILPDES